MMGPRGGVGGAVVIVTVTCVQGYSHLNEKNTPVYKLNVKIYIITQNQYNPSGAGLLSVGNLQKMKLRSYFFLNIKTIWRTHHYGLPTPLMFQDGKNYLYFLVSL